MVQSVTATETVFVNSSREGIERVKKGDYAYLMESSMLEYYIERDCELMQIGGLLDSKGYGIALPKRACGRARAHTRRAQIRPFANPSRRPCSCYRRRLFSRN